ncbi:uncharacterized protein LOC112127800 [Cimex lectularius]|uniref:Uncharacterized protein n=1 Tax=Cimex lectularius TaxID=79782 RepID=A0A8I6STD7_CIMLE|nr:uncharacterized protein LOC112127800 [Cimex lectularius]
MVNMAAEEGLFREREERSEDEISVGCPSPAQKYSESEEDRSRSSEEDRQDDYFKPLKRLKMMQIEQVSYSMPGKKTKRIRPRRQSLPDEQAGVKSFSILDILNHRPARETRIVRPWDFGRAEGSSCLPPPAHRGLLPPPPLLYRLPASRPKSAELYETCSSGRSSTAGSDCCTSPDIVSPRRPQAQQQRKGGKNDTSPLDALFQMTSKTFEELNGESQGMLTIFTAGRRINATD